MGTKIKCFTAASGDETAQHLNAEVEKWQNEYNAEIISIDTSCNKYRWLLIITYKIKKNE